MKLYPVLAVTMLAVAGAALGGHGIATNPGTHLHDDVNRDYRADIFFRHGTALAYSTRGSASSGVYAGDGGPGYRVVAVSDFDGDSSADVLWTNGSHLKLWINNGSGSYTPVSVGNYGGGWEPFAAGDINADGRSDLFFRGSTHLAYWLMDGPNVIRSSYAGDGGAGYRVVAIADFGNRSGDYREGVLGEKISVDVLWANGSDMKLWLGVASTATFESYGLGSYGGGWEPFAVVYSDGDNLILFRGGSHVAYWRLNVLWANRSPPRFAYESHYAGDGGAGYRAIGASEYDNDGLENGDLLWTNGSQLKLWRGTCPDWDYDVLCSKHKFVPQSLGAYGGGWQPLETLIPQDQKGTEGIK